MRKRTVGLIVGIPMLLVAAVLAVPLTYYGNMFLVIALHIRPNAQQISGSYEAETDIGSATLLVRTDHTFTEVVRPKIRTPTTISGTWRPSDIGSVGFNTQFFPYIGVLHDRFQLYAYGNPEFDKNLLGHISIEEDPDWGIFFYKKQVR